MYNELQVVEGVQDAAYLFPHGAMAYQSVIDEQYPVLPAYIESLPTGLIGDEM